MMLKDQNQPQLLVKTCVLSKINTLTQTEQPMFIVNAVIGVTQDSSQGVSLNIGIMF
jgi:hypothetical protein